MSVVRSFVLSTNHVTMLQTVLVAAAKNQLLQNTETLVLTSCNEIPLWSHDQQIADGCSMTFAQTLENGRKLRAVLLFNFC